LFLFMLRQTAETVWGKDLTFIFLTWLCSIESVPEISLLPCMYGINGVEDSHYFGEMDPDVHYSEKLNPDPL